MNKILTFFQSYRYAIIWTICYIISMWAILYFMFKFNLFSGPQWHHLMRAELHGFGGFVFGLLILAMVPLYIASTALIVRTKKPLITIPKPKIQIPSLLRPTPSTPSPKAPTPAESITPTLPPASADTPGDLSPDIPPELHIAFLRARNKVAQSQPSAFNHVPSQSNVPSASDADFDDQSDTLPIPSDFDIEIPDVAPEFTPIPTFTDLTFDSEPSELNDNPPQSENVPSPSIDITEYLTSQNIKFEIRENLVITDTHAIAVHSDTNFWVTDTENWFANGIVRPSPIRELTSIAETTNLSPVLYLAATNIMDLDKLLPEWESLGIRIIRTPSDLD